MKNYIILILLFITINGFSQEDNFISKIICFDYTFQNPINKLSENFGLNSSLGMSYLTNKNDILLGVDANFMYGNNVKNDSLLLLNIMTENGFLINSSGELDDILFYQRGWNTHILIGKSFRFEENYLSGIYVYGGIGYLQHKIRLESNRTYLPQIDENYIKGYDKFTNGISSKLCVNYKYFDKKSSINLYVGLEYINAFTKNRRTYDFELMQEYSKKLKMDQLFGIKAGLIIPINRNNEGKFHFY